MQQWGIIVLVGVFLASCHSTPECKCSVNQKILDENYKYQANLQRVKLEEAALLDIKEPVLSELSYTTYRARYISGKTTRLLRFGDSPSGYYMEYKVLTPHTSGMGTRVEIDEHIIQPLSDAQYERWVKVVESSCLWTARSQPDKRAVSAYWIVELWEPAGNSCSGETFQVVERLAGTGSIAEEVAVDLMTLANVSGH